MRRCSDPPTWVTMKSSNTPIPHDAVQHPEMSP